MDECNWRFEDGSKCGNGVAPGSVVRRCDTHRGGMPIECRHRLNGACGGEVGPDGLCTSHRLAAPWSYSLPELQAAAETPAQWLDRRSRELFPQQLGGSAGEPSDERARRLAVTYAERLRLDRSIDLMSKVREWSAMEQAHQEAAIKVLIEQGYYVEDLDLVIERIGPSESTPRLACRSFVRVREGAVPRPTRDADAIAEMLRAELDESRAEVERLRAALAVGETGRQSLLDQLTNERTERAKLVREHADKLEAVRKAIR